MNGHVGYKDRPQQQGSAAGPPQGEYLDMGVAAALRQEAVLTPGSRSPNDCRILVCDLSAGYGFILNDGGWNQIRCRSSSEGFKSTPVGRETPVRLTRGHPVYLDGLTYTRMEKRGLQSRGYRVESRFTPNKVLAMLSARGRYDLFVTGSEIANLPEDRAPNNLPPGYSLSNPSDVAAFVIATALSLESDLQVIVGKLPDHVSTPSPRLDEVLARPEVHTIQKPFDVTVNGGRNHQHDQVEFLQLVRELLGVQYTPDSQ